MKKYIILPILIIITLILSDVYIEYKKNSSAIDIIKNTLTNNGQYIWNVIKTCYKGSKKLSILIHNLLLKIGKQNDQTLKTIIIGTMLSMIIIYYYISFKWIILLIFICLITFYLYTSLIKFGYYILKIINYVQPFTSTITTHKDNAPNMWQTVRKYYT